MISWVSPDGRKLITIGFSWVPRSPAAPAAPGEAPASGDASGEAMSSAGEGEAIMSSGEGEAIVSSVAGDAVSVPGAGEVVSVSVSVSGAVVSGVPHATTTMASSHKATTRVIHRVTVFLL